MAPHTHIKRMIPVLDIAKANPRIPLPIMALLRLKMDMPNEVFPTNCSEETTENVTRMDQCFKHKSHQLRQWYLMHLISLQKINPTSAFF